MHFRPASSRALGLLPALLLAQAAVAAGPTAASAGSGEAALLDAARGKLRGTVLATARAEFPSGVALLAATQARPKGPVAFMLVAFATEEGSLSIVGRDEVKVGELFGAPVVSISPDAHPVASGELTVTVGWRAADGSSSLETFLYRQAGGRLMRLLAVEPDRTWAERGRPGERHELEVLATRTAGFRDLRVRTLECAAQGECGLPTEVEAFVFDGVRYAQRPHAIPFLESIVASSELASGGALADHSASAAVDGRADTAWCEGAPGPGWFQKLELAFVPGQLVKAVSILPGGPRGEPFGDWTRPKRVRLLLSDGRKVEADLADEPRAQRIALPDGERIFGLSVVLVDVYKGKKDAACIAELDLEVEP